MNTTFFEERLENSPNFDGFFPRTYIPQTKLTSYPTHSDNVTVTLVVLDTVGEIKVGVGLDWYPLILGPQEIQIQT